MTNKPMRIFLDTDIGPDCDDTAALAILLELCREGRGTLIGVTHCTGSPYGLACIDAICRCFGAELPLGTCPDKDFLSDERAYLYTKPVHDAFPHRFPADQPQPDCLQTLIDVLEKEEDGSVTMIAIGPLNNIARYLRDPIAGPLMRKKVNQLAVMAGAFEEPGHVEWNVEMDIPAARIVAGEWEGEMLWAPFEPMEHVLVGECLRGRENPVAMAYRIHTEGRMLRPSWDLECVAAAVLGAEDPYAWSEPGTVTVDETGRTAFSPAPESRHRYLRLTGTAADAAAYLEGLLSRAICRMESGK